MTDLTTGWPRPLRPFEYAAPRPDGDHADGEVPTETVMLPLPWLTPDGGPRAWTAIRPDAAVAHDRRLCQVCGEKLGRLIVLGAAWVEMRRTHGPGMHPRCAALAVKFCPSFDQGEDATVGWAYTGDGVGYEHDADAASPYEWTNTVAEDAHPVTRAQVKQLARRDPLGDTPPGPGGCPHRHTRDAVRRGPCPASTPAHLEAPHASPLAGR